jgi:hypothetical protein
MTQMIATATMMPTRVTTLRWVRSRLSEPVKLPMSD